jgi:hypothetical protein
MIDRVLARVGTFGVILILVVAVVTTGFVGGVVEHFRLAAQHQQQPGQSGAGAESQSQSVDQAGQQGESQNNDSENGTSANQTGEQGDHTSGATAGAQGGD